MVVAVLYGIKNCDTVKKARKWLENKGINYRFHDFREQGIDKQQAANWVKQLGWETVVNKRSATWKQLDTDLRDNMDETSAINAIMANPTLVKRPLLEIHGDYFVGFSTCDYEAIF